MLAIIIMIKQVIGQLKGFLKPVFESRRSPMACREASRALSKYVSQSRARTIEAIYCSRPFEARAFQRDLQQDTKPPSVVLCPVGGLFEAAQMRFSRRWKEQWVRFDRQIDCEQRKERGT
jgi:hypothetical protein